MNLLTWWRARTATPDPQLAREQELEAEYSRNLERVAQSYRSRVAYLETQVHAQAVVMGELVKQIEDAGGRPRVSPMAHARGPRSIVAFDDPSTGDQLFTTRLQ